MLWVTRKEKEEEEEKEEKVRYVVIYYSHLFIKIKNQSNAY